MTAGAGAGAGTGTGTAVAGTGAGTGTAVAGTGTGAGTAVAGTGTAVAGTCTGFGAGTGRLMGDDEIPDLFSFLLSNGYSIDTGLTRMMNTSEVRLDNKKIIAFITYIG